MKCGCSISIFMVFEVVCILVCKEGLCVVCVICSEQFSVFWYFIVFFGCDYYYLFSGGCCIGYMFGIGLCGWYYCGIVGFGCIY